MPLVASEGPWRGGINSVDHSADLLPGQYQWLTNGVNKGGIVSTRPGMASIPFPPVGGYDTGINALTIFTPRNGTPVLVMALDAAIQYVRYPFTSTAGILGSISMNGPTVQFETAVIGVTEAPNGTITAIDPYPVLMICDGTGRTAMWDGATLVRYLDPTVSETPTATWMKWIGNRLWVAQGRKLRASNLLNPVKFTEENILAEGGYFNLPSDCTGLGVTPDFRSLLAFTDYTTTAFQAGLINRASWGSTADFQKVIFSYIGCAAGRSIVNQYGMTWWYSHNGLINLDSALQTYRSSQISIQDRNMRRSVANFSNNISGICATAYDNYLLISVPSGDLHNFHTWVLDESIVESIDPSPTITQSSKAGWASAWTGIRPTQFATGVVQGKMRCFCATCDISPTGYSSSPIKGNVWELFLQDRRDIGYNSSIVTTAKDISCSLETRSIDTKVLCEIKYVELDIEEIVGTVQLDIYYATRRGTYKKFGTKQIVGTVGSVTSSMTIPVTFSQYLPQRRTVKSVNECILASDSNPSVETPQTRNIDKYFSFIIKWTGQMSLVKMRVYADPVPEQMDGASESNEITDRYIRPDGTGAILSTGPSALPIVSQQSGFLATTSCRFPEEIYQSLT